LIGVALTFESRFESIDSKVNHIIINELPQLPYFLSNLIQSNFVAWPHQTFEIDCAKRRSCADFSNAQLCGRNEVSCRSNLYVHVTCCQRVHIQARWCSLTLQHGELVHSRCELWRASRLLSTAHEARGRRALSILSLSLSLYENEA